VNIHAGGETIRDINQQSGAYVELQRGPSANPGEKVFTVRGNPGQIQHAIQLIAEKAGLVSRKTIVFKCVDPTVSESCYRNCAV